VGRGFGSCKRALAGPGRGSPHVRRLWPCTSRVHGELGRTGQFCSYVNEGSLLRGRIDGAGELSFEAADRLTTALAFVLLAFQVGAGRCVYAALPDRDPMQNAVQLSVAAAVEAVAPLLARAGIERGDASRPRVRAGSLRAPTDARPRASAPTRPPRRPPGHFARQACGRTRRRRPPLPSACARPLRSRSLRSPPQPLGATGERTARHSRHSCQAPIRSRSAVSGRRRRHTPASRQEAGTRESSQPPRTRVSAHTRTTLEQRAIECGNVTR
jgi:hypothetical protein